MENETRYDAGHAMTTPGTGGYVPATIDKRICQLQKAGEQLSIARAGWQS
jgi:hypothetical protein